jgi:hypothetical protein
MKNSKYKIRNYWLPALFAFLLLGAGSCKKNNTAPPPVIRSVRNYVPAPGDSLLTTAGPGQWVVIEGSNLKGALHIYFDGVASSFNEALFSDTSAAVLIPAVIAFPTVAANKLNIIDYVTTHGETTFKVNIYPPGPSITNISNENANPGDSVTISGLNLFFIQSVTWSGANIPTFLEAVDGTYIRFVVPPLTQSGPVKIVATGGTVSTLFNVNDAETGIISNFDDINNYAYFGANLSSDPTLYPGNRGQYAQLLDTTTISAYNTAWYNGGQGVNMNQVQWIPAARLSDPLADYAVKFEMNIPTPWSGGTVIINPVDYNANFPYNNYLIRFEPWLNTDGSTTPFTTRGWQTFTFPFSDFKTQPANGLYGTGNPASLLTDILSASGQKYCDIWYINDRSTPVPGSGHAPAFNAAFDNIRVIKIK